MDLINTKSDRNGKIAAGIYTLVFILFMFLKTCSSPTEDYTNEGVIINLGFTKTGISENTPEALQEEIVVEVTPQEIVEEVTPQEVMEENINKLESRYPNGFDVTMSENRQVGDI